MSSRKLIAIISIAVMIFSLPACGTKQQAPDSGEREASPSPDYTLATPDPTIIPIPGEPAESPVSPKPSEDGKTKPLTPFDEENQAKASTASETAGKPSDSTDSPDKPSDSPDSPDKQSDSSGSSGMSSDSLGNSNKPSGSLDSSCNPGDKPLAGRIVCVDPGHQSVMKKVNVPIAPGSSVMMPDFAIGTKGVSTGVFEYAVVLDVSKKLKKALEDLGAEVILTRDAPDEAVSNIERAQIANNANADIFVRVHCDGSDIQDAKGISVLYPGDKYIKDKVMLDKSLALSKSILEGTVRATQAKNRGLSERNDLIGFNYSKVPSTLIEMGFMTNPDEDRLLNSDSYQNKLVEGIVDGIREYFKLE